MAKKARRDISASMDKIPELPQELLQNIQYFLPPKQAAQTAILSKAWGKAWSNRPNIDLEELSFRGTNDEFLTLVNDTLQSHHDNQLRIKSFKLGLWKLDSESLSLLEQWIPVLVHMGVESFRLSVLRDNMYLLPHAIFDVESLLDLSLNGCRLNQIFGVKVMFKHLKVLKLTRVYIEDTTFQRIISSCPLIQLIELICCYGLRSIKVNDLRNLKNSYYVYSYGLYTDEYPSIEWGVTNLEFITIDRCPNWFGLHKCQLFPKLKHLSLTKVSLSGLSSYNFSSYLPNLEYLILDNCYDFKTMRISSHSILDFTLRVMDRFIQARIDCPNILRFQYTGFFPSIISFGKTQSKWSSNITLDLDEAPLVWSKLNDMLKELSQSEISLNLVKLPNYLHKNGDAHFKPVEVENMVLHYFYQQSSSSIDGLFSVCRPKTVNMYWYGNEDGELLRENNEFVEYVCGKLMEIRESRNFKLFWQKDLIEVSLKAFDSTTHEWYSLRGTSLRECLPNDQSQQEIRFQLKWTETSTSA